MINQDAKQELIHFSQQLIQRKSLSGQENEVAALIQERMQALGFDEVTVDRYGSVLGTIQGSRPGKAVLLDGHIDTVDVADPSQWTHDPYGAELVDGRIYGRGSSDMKSSVAAMILAAAAYGRDSHKDFAGSVHVSCTVHEECFEGVSSREITKQIKPDYVIIGEATNLTLKRGQRGRAEITVETEGVSCHSSNPESGVNAVQHMCAVIAAINGITLSEHPLLGKGILELTDIISSPYPGASVVPERCRVTFDRRTLPGETAESVLEPVRQAIAQVQQTIPNLKARAYLASGEEPCYTGETIRAERFFPAWVLDEQDELVQKALRGLRAEGIEAPLSHFAFCTNGSHFCGEAGIPTVGFGPSLENLAHVVDEYIETDSLTQAYRGFYGMIKELTT